TEFIGILFYDNLANAFSRKKVNIDFKHQTNQVVHYFYFPNYLY
ncbi:MAG: hypothetical protein RL711_85, partial [Bacteroidota bacterium]